MSSINWDVVAANAKIKGADYAKSKPLRNEQDLSNGYFQGYMECAGERESLRVINDRLRAQIAAGGKVVMQVHDEIVLEMPSNLDDLI